MAEVVELRCERLLPEYEQMKKYDLFTDEEIRIIIKTRESFEYKVNRQTKTIKDLVEYITYERNLRTKVSERWARTNGAAKCSVEVSISNHIRNLYKEALGRFPEEMRLWTNYLKFCKHANFLSDCSTAFEKMLQYHSDKPDIWLKAAMWEYHEMNNPNRAKDFFLRGLQRHPEHADLYTKFFNLLLNEASKMSRELLLEGNTQSEQSIGMERVEVVYENARKKINSCEFFVSLLEIATEFNFTKKLQKKILLYMMDAYCRTELLWHMLAQREIKGYNMASLDEEEPDPVKIEGEEIASANTKRTLRRRIELGVEVYSTALRELKTEKMSSYYINAMIELNEDTSTQRDFKRKCLTNAFRAAYDANCLSEQHYLQYLELLLQSRDNDEFVLEALEKATTNYSCCLKLWELWLRFYMVKGDVMKTEEIFRKANKKLASQAHPLWRLMILFYQTYPENSDKVDDLYKEASRQESPLFEKFRPDYLEWVALTKSMITARRVYKEMAVLPPPSLALHEKMASLELMQIKPDIKSWRQCHEYATHYFGKVQTDVWINYIKFERDHGEAKNMNLIYERAKQSLSEELVDNFISEHSLLTTGII